MNINEIKIRSTYYDAVSGDPVKVTGKRPVTVGIRETEREEMWCLTSDGLLCHPERLQVARPTHRWDGSAVA